MWGQRITQQAARNHLNTPPVRQPMQRRMPVCRYQGAEFAAAAVEVRSDGSAAIQWPEGSMAAALDVESSMNGAYRLLAMYRSVTGAAASFDSNGGFVQYPTGSLMLVWNKKDGIGTCYGPDGAITHSFNSRK